MQAAEKFGRDVDQALRRSSGRGPKAEDEALRALFSSSFPFIGEEARAALFASYLERKRASPEKALAWLRAIGSVLLMDYDGSPLEREDWTELCEALNLEADTADMDFLTYAMSLVVEHGAL